MWKERMIDCSLAMVWLTACHAARVEVPGLIAAQTLWRPADVLMSAAFGRLAALDVSVVAPHAGGAGADAAAAQVVGKVCRYGPYLEALAADGMA